VVPDLGRSDFGRPGRLLIGDAHVYLDHVDALRQQIEGTPTTPFPSLSIAEGKTDIDGFEFADLTLHNYAPQRAIPLRMAV
jgi:thymidylate synthase